MQKKIKHIAHNILYFFLRVDDLKTSNSLFSANPVLENTAHDRQKYCSCATEASDGIVLQDHAAVCNITKTIVECSKHRTTASFHTTCGRDGNTGRKRRALSEDGLSEKSKRVRRSTKDFDDVIDFVPLLLDPLYNSTYIPQVIIPMKDPSVFNRGGSIFVLCIRNALLTI